MGLISGKPRAITNRVIITDMYFGEQKTASGVIIKSDDGTTRGIYPRWGRVVDKGKDNVDEYQIGDWVLVEHGRWTRSFTMTDQTIETTYRMVDPDNILAFNTHKPNDLQVGAEYSNGQSASFDPQLFSNI